MKKSYLLLFTLLLQACAKDSGIPAYLYISESQVTSDYPKQGSNSHKITDVWVNVNNKSVGIFELPATIPVLEEGLQEVFISPGIKINGISASRGTYLFYKSYSADVLFVRGQTKEVKPVYTYASYANFDWMEDFEGIGTSFVTGSNSQGSMQFTSKKEEVFEGYQSGLIYLDANKNNFFISSEKDYKFSREGAVYLEMNYKINNAMRVAMYVNYSTSVESIDVMTLNARTNENGEYYWNKIYINLTSYINNSPDAKSYKIVFYADKETEGDAYFYFDNIKLIRQ